MWFLPFAATSGLLHILSVVCRNPRYLLYADDTVVILIRAAKTNTSENKKLPKPSVSDLFALLSFLLNTYLIFKGLSEEAALTPAHSFSCCFRALNSHKRTWTDQTSSLQWRFWKSFQKCFHFSLMFLSSLCWTLKDLQGEKKIFLFTVKKKTLWLHLLKAKGQRWKWRWFGWFFFSLMFLTSLIPAGFCPPFQFLSNGITPQTQGESQRLSCSRSVTDSRLSLDFSIYSDYRLPSECWPSPLRAGNGNAMGNRSSLVTFPLLVGKAIISECVCCNHWWGLWESVAVMEVWRQRCRNGLEI